MAQEFSWRRAVSRHLLIYAFDMAIAICGWTFGFGLHVVSWPALLVLLILSRFVVATLSLAWLRADAARNFAASVDDVFIRALADQVAERLARQPERRKYRDEADEGYSMGPVHWEAPTAESRVGVPTIEAADGVDREDGNLG